MIESDESSSDNSGRTLPRIGTMPGIPRFNSEEEEIEEESSESQSSSQGDEVPLQAPSMRGFHSLSNYFT